MAKYLRNWLCIPSKHYMVGLDFLAQLRSYYLERDTSLSFCGDVIPANRIFDTFLYDYFLSAAGAYVSEIYKEDIWIIMNKT